MQDYAGVMRSEKMLEAGHGYLKNLRKKITAGMIARNRWELTRCLEVFNLLDIGEIVEGAIALRIPLPMTLLSRQD